MDFTIPSTAADALRLLLTNILVLGAASALITHLILSLFDNLGENWNRFISNVVPIAIVLLLYPFGVWRGYFGWSDDELFNMLVGAVGIGFGKQIAYNAAQGVITLKNRSAGVPNEPGS